MTIREIPQLIDDLRTTFHSGKTRPLSWRREQLTAIRRLLTENEQALTEALSTDLGKSDFEGWVSEVNFTVNEIDHILKHLASWARPEPVPTPMVVQPASSEIVREPLGVVLIISPWNYPIQLAFSPLVAALSAGNCAVVKPSEVAPASSAVIARLIPEYLDTSAVRVVEGGVPETTELLDQRWDHILFTGSGHIGKIVMTAAAKHLTPVTLELGGKSPCIVDRKVKMGVAARRILWGKFFNAGQTCIAPDYILVHSSREQELFDAFDRALARFYPEGPKNSGDYGRIINERHFDRLASLLEGQEIASGGETDREERYIAPTILRNVDPDSPVMQDEIFGPILPVLTWNETDEVVRFVNERPKPLALYLFSSDPAMRDTILGRTSSGGACINQTLLHLAVPDLPFGGVGGSGMGAYHGRAGFETFTHRKSVLTRTTLVDPDLIYPPFTASKMKWTRRLA